MADAPVTDDFLADVMAEAAYQRDRWGDTHDADKDDSSWFWTLGHIAGKAIHDDHQTVEKQRHRLRAAAALLLNWDRHIASRNGLPAPPVSPTAGAETTLSMPFADCPDRVRQGRQDRCGFFTHPSRCAIVNGEVRCAYAVPEASS